MVKRISFLVPLVALAGALAAAEPALSIRYFDKRIYYLPSDPIKVEITLTNSGPEPFRFKLADERAFSVDFEVRTTANRPVEAALTALRRRSESRQVFFREVSIEAGESFSFIEDLRDYARLDQSGSYVVQARVFPELYQSPAAPLESNRLSLTVKPPPAPVPGGAPVVLDLETSLPLARERIPPDEVVGYLLTARQRSQWEKFFLYLDLEAMAARDPARRRQWQAESEEGRARMTAQYRADLQSETIDGDIAAVPRDFVIEQTVYGPDEGAVTALEFFKVGAYTERKRFTYYLRRRDSVWTIVDYSVVNLGTE